MNYQICRGCKSVFYMGTLTIPGRCVICDTVFESEKNIRVKSQEQLKEVDKKRLERTQKKLARLAKKKAKEQRRLERVKNKAFREQKKADRQEKSKLKSIVNTIDVENKVITINSGSFVTKVDSLQFKKLPAELSIKSDFNEKYIVRANDKDKPSSGEVFIFKRQGIDKKDNKFVEVITASGATNTILLEELRRYIPGHDKSGPLRNIEAIIDKFGSLVNACRHVLSKKDKSKKKK